MNAPHKFDTPVPATREHELRILVERLLEGDFSGVPLNWHTELEWTDTARWFADVAGEPIDEAQVLAEIELMIARSSYSDGWMRLSDSEQAAYAYDCHNYFDARHRDRTVHDFHGIAANDRRVGQFCADLLSGVRK